MQTILELKESNAFVGNNINECLNSTNPFNLSINSFLYVVIDKNLTN